MLKVSSICRGSNWGSLLLIIYSAFVKYLRKKGAYNEAVHHNMAEGISCYGGHSSILAENEVNMENCACYKCSNYKEKLKIVSDELKSAEIII